jgi:hypothetical protein
MDSNDENCFAPDADRYKIIVGSLRYAPSAHHPLMGPHYPHPRWDPSNLTP